MAITLSGSTILVSSGIASGTATGGTATTLTGSGFSSAWAGRIIFLIGGTGSGQSRAIKSATTNTITVHQAWDVQPNATTTYIVSHDVGDIVGTNGAAYVGDSRGKTVRYDAGGIAIQAGAVFGGLKSGLLLGLSEAQLVVNGLLQFGHAIGSEGRDGGFISLQSQSNAYMDMEWAGRARLYGCLMQAQQGTSSGKLVRINQNTNPAEFTAVSCTFEGVVVVQRGTNVTTLRNCRFVGERAGFFSGTPNAINQNSIVFSGVLSPRTDAGGETRGAVEFDVQYLGSPPSDSFFNAPVFLFQYSLPNGIHYYVNTTFPTGYASAFRWYLNTGTGRIYEAYSVRPVVVDAAGAGVQDVLLSLLDASGSAGWWTSKDASFEPVKTATLTTNANGTITSAIGTGEAGLVIRNRWTRTSEYVSGATSYGPFTLRVRKYGFDYIKKTALDYTARTTETIAMVPNTSITQTNPATVAAYTTLETSAKLYDYYQYFLSLAANIAIDIDITRTDLLINAGSLNVVIDATAASVFTLAGNTLTIKASTYTGDMTTTGVITLANGATFVGTRTDANGTIAPPKTASVTGIETGSRIQVYNVTTSTEIANEIVSGTSWSLVYVEGTSFTSGNTVRIRVRKPGQLPYETLAIASSTGWSTLVDQQIDPIFSASSPSNYSCDFVNQKIRATGSRASFTAQEIVDIIRDCEATSTGIQLPSFAEISGLVELSPSVFTAITVDLLGWQLSWAAGSVSQASVSGGNVVGGISGDPIEDVVGGPQVTVRVSADSTVVATGSGVLPADITAIAAAVWDTVLSGHLTAGTTGAALDDAAAGGGGGGGSGDWTATEKNQIRHRLGIDGTASGPTTGVPSLATPASVRTELATELGRIDVATSTRLASASYTTPPTVAAIRTEIDTNSTKLDVAVGTRLASASYTTPPTAAANATAVRAELTTELGRIDVATSTRLASSSYTAPANADITAIKAKTDNLPIDPADESSIQAAIAAIPTAPTASTVASAVRTELTIELARVDVATSTRLATSGYTAPANADISAIKAKTDNLPSDPADESSIQAAIAAIPVAPSASSVATAVRTELTTELGRIDVATSTRLATSGYTAPDNATIAAIDGKVDNLPTLAEVEASTVLAKEATVESVKQNTDLIPATV